MHFRRAHRGFTLVEILVSLAILGLLASIAVPSYTDYLRRSRVPPALSALSSLAVRLEQFYQDNSTYGVGSCGSGITMPNGDKFTVTCSLTNSGQGFTATATGQAGTLSAGYTYTIDHQSKRQTTAHPKASSLPMDCWSIKGNSCDA